MLNTPPNFAHPTSNGSQAHMDGAKQVSNSLSSAPKESKAFSQGEQACPPTEGTTSATATQSPADMEHTAGERGIGGESSADVLTFYEEDEVDVDDCNAGATSSEQVLLVDGVVYDGLTDSKKQPALSAAEEEHKRILECEHRNDLTAAWLVSAETT